MPPSGYLGLTYMFSEVALSTFKRARAGTGADRGSMALLWLVIAGSVAASMIVRPFTPWAQVEPIRALRPLWLVLFVAALGLRWWAIVHLGRFFTVNVAIAADQHVVDTGPYALVRHPSYTGALAAFFFYALYVGHWIGLLLIMLPITAAFLRRMTVEEQALSTGLGEPYRAYMRRTKRLLPFVY